MESIRVIIADDIEQTRENIRMLLELDRDVVVVGEAANGEQALELAKTKNPDVVLMDINMPVMDGIRATEAMSIRYPRVAVIIISVQGEQEYLKKAMMAGAKEYMIKPFTADELTSTIKKVVDINRRRSEVLAPVQPQAAAAVRPKPKIISLFSAKGGVGKTSIAVNLAVGLAHKTRARVALVDLDLQFGDVAVMMNIHPKRTIAELIQETTQLDTDYIESYLYERNGVRVLSAPNKPELAEIINDEGVTSTLKALMESYDYIVVDTPAAFNDVTLAALDLSDTILMVTTPDLPALKNNKRSLDAMKTLSMYDKVKLILNRSSGGFGVEEDDVQRSMDMKISIQFPSDARLVVASMNRGMPFVLIEPGSMMAKSVNSIITLITGEEKKAEKPVKSGGLFVKAFFERPVMER